MIDLKELRAEALANIEDGWDAYTLVENKTVLALLDAVDTLKKIRDTECGEPHKRWCCQFRHWAGEALKEFGGKDD